MNNEILKDKKKNFVFTNYYIKYFKNKKLRKKSIHTKLSLQLTKVER